MIRLFHGSTMEVADPLVGVGRKKVDFGQGFYLTTEQVLGQLAYKKVNHQIAILSQTIVDRCLKFKSSVSVSPKGERHA